MIRRHDPETADLALPISFIDRDQRVIRNSWAQLELISPFERSVEPIRSLGATFRLQVRIEEGAVDTSWRIVERVDRDRGMGGRGRFWSILAIETSASGRFLMLLALAG